MEMFETQNLKSLLSFLQVVMTFNLPLFVILSNSLSFLRVFVLHVLPLKSHNPRVIVSIDSRSEAEGE